MDKSKEMTNRYNQQNHWLMALDLRLVKMANKTCSSQILQMFRFHLSRLYQTQIHSLTI